MRKKTRFLVVFLLVFLIADKVVAAPPQISGESFILYDPSSQEMLVEKDVHKKFPVAGSTKVLTVLVALENGNLKDEVTIGSNAAQAGGYKVYLKEGDKVSLEKLVNAVLIHSANDAAIAIAEHIGDSGDEFLKMMNQKAKEIGCKDSNFLNPHGLAEENHESSAYDLALISTEAMKNADFRRIVIKKEYSWVGSEWENNLVNSNKLLWKMPESTGIKAGYTEVTKNTLLASAKKNDRELICVIQGAETESIYDEAQALLEYGFDNFQTLSFMEEDKAVVSIKLEGGKEVELLAARPLNITVPSGEESKYQRQVLIKKASLPIKKGEILGELVVSVDGQEKDRIPLKAKESVKAKFNFVKAILYTLAAIYILQIITRVYKMSKKKRKKASRRSRSEDI